MVSGELERWRLARHDRCPSPESRVQVACVSRIGLGPGTPAKKWCVWPPRKRECTGELLLCGRQSVQRETSKVAPDFQRERGAAVVAGTEALLELAYERSSGRVCGLKLGTTAQWQQETARRRGHTTVVFSLCHLTIRDHPNSMVFSVDTCMTTLPCRRRLSRMDFPRTQNNVSSFCLLRPQSRCLASRLERVDDRLPTRYLPGTGLPTQVFFPLRPGESLIACVCRARAS